SGTRVFPQFDENLVRLPRNPHPPCNDLFRTGAKRCFPSFRKDTINRSMRSASSLLLDSSVRLIVESLNGYFTRFSICSCDSTGFTLVKPKEYFLPCLLRRKWALT